MLGALRKSPWHASSTTKKTLIFADVPQEVTQNRAPLKANENPSTDLAQHHILDRASKTILYEVIHC